MSQPPTILLRSGWQTANIGDIAHTPGMLALIERHLPGTRVILWYGSVGQGVEPVLRRRFSGLRMLPADPATRRPQDLSVEDALAEADFLLHGSGPSLVGMPQVSQWIQQTGKPWGAIGVTLESPDSQTAELLNTASLIYTRETHSLDHLLAAKVTRPTVAFAPDATFACDLRDDLTADSYLQGVGLAGRPFICVIPRLRRTPYYRIHPNPEWWTPQRVAELDALNARHAEPDHALLRRVIVRYVTQTGGNVLLCPEMEYQLELMNGLLRDPLPEPIRSHVVARDQYWLPDEAAGVYRRAEGLIGFECHSPILCCVQGVPGFYVRQPEDTIKGRMYHDLGLADRVAEIDLADGDGLADRFLSLLSDRVGADRRLSAAMAFAENLAGQAMRQLGRSLSFNSPQPRV